MKKIMRNCLYRFGKWRHRVFIFVIGIAMLVGPVAADNTIPIETLDWKIDGNSHFAPTKSIRLPSIDNHCMGDVASANGISGLNCTANDIDIAEALDINIIAGDPDPNDGVDECTIGEDVTFSAKFRFELSAQERHDLGVWFATGGQPDARSGACLVSTGPLFSNASGFLNDLDGMTTGVCSSDTSQKCNADSDCRGKENICSFKPDYCGDIDDSTSPQFFEIEITTACVDKDRNGELDLPVCLSWRQPGADEYCKNAEDAYPGSPSKCNCDDTFSVPIQVPTPPLQVFKSISPATLDEPGGTATVVFDIVNPSLFGNDVDISAMVDRLDDYVVDGDDSGMDITVNDADFTGLDVTTLTLYGDSQFADVALSCVQYPEAYSATPSSTPSDFDPSSDLLSAQEDGTFDPAILTPNFVRCSFTRFVGGEIPGSDIGFFFDQVMVEGLDEGGNITQGKDSASLQILDVPPKASLIKTANPTSLTEAQIAGGNTDITYTVEIKVPSDSDTVTVDCLDDSTNIDSPVATYACGSGSSLLVDNTGSPSCASLNGTTIAPAGSVKCQFVAPAYGISETGQVLHDRVVVQVSDDEGGTVSPSDTAMVTVTNSPPAIKLTKTGAPTDAGVNQEPSYQATYTYVIENITEFDDIVVLDKLEDTITLVDGTLLPVADITNSCVDSAGDTLLTAQEAPVELVKGESFTCTLTRIVGLDNNGDPAGDAPGLTDSGNTEDNLATITGHEKGIPGAIIAMDNESLGFADALPSAVVKKEVKTLTATYKVTVSNTSVEALDLTALNDSINGVSVDITGFTFAPTDTNLNACDVSGQFELAKQNTGNTDDYVCYFTRSINAEGSVSPIINTITATAVDDEGNEVNPSAKAQIAWVSNFSEP